MYLQTLEVTASTAYVGDIKQAIRFAAGDLKGQQYMPGFCLPKVRQFRNSPSVVHSMF